MQVNLYSPASAAKKLFFRDIEDKHYAVVTQPGHGYKLNEVVIRAGDKVVSLDGTGYASLYWDQNEVRLPVAGEVFTVTF